MILYCAALPQGGTEMIRRFVQEIPGGEIVPRPRKLLPMIRFQSGRLGTQNM